ncbi:MAG: hypothetical protein DMG09_12630 [Acidobacteria bacterium]|nr:MAG: hypothetical protein DMG09_12630 [Acidobacteriota bacterium]
MRTIVRWSVSAATILLFALPAIAQVQYRLEFYGGVTIPKDKDFEIGFPQFPVFVHDISDLGVTLPSGRLVGNLDPVRGSYTQSTTATAHTPAKSSTVPVVSRFFPLPRGFTRYPGMRSGTPEERRAKVKFFPT